MHAAPEEVSRGPHPGGIDICMEEHPAPQWDRDFVRINPIVFGLAPWIAFM
jgi:hypothetical protein